MASPLHGEHRRAVIMAGVGVTAIAAFLAFGALSGTGVDDWPPTAGPVSPPAPGPGAAPPVIPPPPPAPAPADPASLRDPFCPLVAPPAGPEAAPLVCRRPPAAPGRRAVRLEDIFAAADTTLARMQVGPFTFPALRPGDGFAGSFRVVSLSGRCGVFEHDGTSFELCVGEETLR